MVGRGAGGCGALRCLEGAGQVLLGRFRAGAAEQVPGRCCWSGGGTGNVWLWAQLGMAARTAVLRAMMHATGRQGTLPCVPAGRCMWGWERERWAHDAGHGAAR